MPSMWCWNSEKDLLDHLQDTVKPSQIDADYTKFGGVSCGSGLLIIHWLTQVVN
jgi:hypothetical protein